MAGPVKPPRDRAIGPSELGDWLGVSAERVRQFAADGTFKRIAKGRYPLRANVRAYIAWLKDEQRRAKKGEAKEEVERERARKLRFENDECERLLYRADDALAAIDAIVGPIKADLAGLAPRFTDDIAERRRLEDLVDVVLAGLADRALKAGAALSAGRDALATEPADEPDGLGEAE